MSDEHRILDVRADMLDALQRLPTTQERCALLAEMLVEHIDAMPNAKEVAAALATTMMRRLEAKFGPVGRA